MKQLTKLQNLTHAKLVAKVIDQPNPDPDCIGGREWIIETIYGTARISVHPGDSSIYWRFQNPNSGWKEALRGEFHHNGGHLNNHSGKWNLHASGPDPVAESQYNAARLKSRLRKLSRLNG